MTRLPSDKRAYGREAASPFWPPPHALKSSRCFRIPLPLIFLPTGILDTPSHHARRGETTKRTTRKRRHLHSLPPGNLSQEKSPLLDHGTLVSSPNTTSTATNSILGTPSLKAKLCIYSPGPPGIYPRTDPSPWNSSKATKFLFSRVPLTDLRQPFRAAVWKFLCRVMVNGTLPYPMIWNNYAEARESCTKLQPSVDDDRPWYWDLLGI